MSINKEYAMKKIVFLIFVLAVVTFIYYVFKNKYVNNDIFDDSNIKCISHIDSIKIQGEEYKDIRIYKYEPPLDISKVKPWTEFNQVSLDTPEKAYFARLSARSLEWFLSFQDSNKAIHVINEYKTNTEYRAWMDRLFNSKDRQLKEPYSVFYYKYVYEYKGIEYAMLIKITYWKDAPPNPPAFIFYKKINGEWKETDEYMDEYFCSLVSGAIYTRSNTNYSVHVLDEFNETLNNKYGQKYK